MATFGTFTSGQVLTSSELNTAGAWQDYTPTFTQSATITKTVNWARFTQLNKLVQVSIKMTASSAGTADNLILVGLPVNASTNNFLMGQAINFTTVNFARYIVFESATAVKFTTSFAAASSASFHGLTAGDGVTVASGNIYYLNFAYEAA